MSDSGRVIGKVFDDAPDKQGQPGILPGLQHASPESFSNESDPFVISIGNNRVRKQLSEQLPVSFTTAVHPSVLCSPTAKLGEGTIVLHGSIIQSNTELGRHVLINTAASIDHHNVIGDFAHISPHATLSGHVEIGEGTHVGVGATIIHCIKIGKWCTIGAGAVVIRDVPDYAVVVGNPARILRMETPE